MVKMSTLLPLLLLIMWLAQSGFCITTRNVKICSDEELELFSKRHYLSSNDVDTESGYHLTVKEKLLSSAALSIADINSLTHSDEHQMIEYQSKINSASYISIQCRRFPMHAHKPRALARTLQERLNSDKSCNYSMQTIYYFCIKFSYTVQLLGGSIFKPITAFFIEVNTGSIGQQAAHAVGWFGLLDPNWNITQCVLDKVIMHKSLSIMAAV